MRGRTGFTRQSTDQTLPVGGGQHALRESQPLGARRPPQRSGGLLRIVLEGRGWSLTSAAADFVLLSVAVVVALGPDMVLDAPADSVGLFSLPPLAMLALYSRGLYRPRMRALILDSVVPVVSAISIATMAAATIGWIVGGTLSDPDNVVRTWLFAMVAVGVGRAALMFVQRRARVSSLIGRPALIIGAGIVGAQVARRLEDHAEYGLVPVGFLDDEPRSIAEVGGRNMPVLGAVDDLDRIVRETGVKHVIVAFSTVADMRVSRLIQRSQQLGLEVSVVPRMFDTINNRVVYEPVGGLPLLSFKAVDPKGVQFAVKHAFDRAFAGAVVFLLLPLLGLIAIAVRLSSAGSVLYRQRRVGRDGKVFDLYKFRSMRPSEAGSGSGELTADVEALLGGDTAPGGVEGVDRRTAVGRLLRRTSLDELPQLFNVLRGEMSVVGPRPERPEFVDLFTQDVARYGDRHRVRSGITGWAQVNGLRGQTSLAERVEMDNYYIAHWSLGLDLKILLWTITALFHEAE